MLIYICGYKGHGKDTFADHLISKNFLERENEKYKYDIYVKITSYYKHAFFMTLKGEKIQRIAFADALKEEICALYHIDKIPISLAEKEAKHILLPLKEGNEYVSFRDLCIKHALVRRAEDTYYWVNKAFAKITDSVEENNNTVIFTDWRFKNEYEPSNNAKNMLCWYHRDNITMRIFRHDGPEPGNIASEHELDDVETDFIIIPHGESIDNNKFLTGRYFAVPILRAF